MPSDGCRVRRGSGAAGRRGSKLTYRFLADLVVGLHFGFVLFVMLGGLLVLRWPWVAYLHIPAALWGAAIEFGGWICPLTPLEHWLLRQAGSVTYSGGFVEHYILPLLYPSTLTRDIQLILGFLVIAFNVTIYAYVFRKAAQRNRRRPTRTDC
jgi:hypothetical protein